MSRILMHADSILVESWYVLPAVYLDLSPISFMVSMTKPDIV